MNEEDNVRYAKGWIDTHREVLADIHSKGKWIDFYDAIVDAFVAGYDKRGGLL